MKKTLFIFIGILNLFIWNLNVFAKGKLLHFYAANNSNIQYVGRIDFTNPKLPRFWQPGVYIHLNFIGKYCEVILNDEMLWGKNHNYLEIVLDGTAVRLQTKGKTDTISVGKNLANGLHTLTICKNTEANIGYLELVGIRCEKLVKPSVKPIHKIEFIGNSITCGASSDQSEMPCGKGLWQDQHNAYMAYGPVVSRALNAQYYLSSVSGIGLMHSCCGMNVIMPQVFDKVSMRNDSITWNFNNYVPDLVTVCLGQNDGIQDSTIFSNNYIAFIKRLRGYYPKAKIICLTSPMADQKLKYFMVKSLAGIVNKMHESGDINIYQFAFLKRYIGGCDSHPSMAEHTLIANELMPFIKKITGW